MSQYILATRPVDGRHGRMEKVEGSGWRKRSLFTSLSNPATAEASKEMPSLNALSSCPDRMEMFFCTPKASKKARRMNFTSSSSTNVMTFSY